MKARPLLWFTCWLLWSVASIASDSLQLSVGHWSMNDIKAQNIQFDIGLTAVGIDLTVSADSIRLAAPIGLVTNLNLHCDKLLLQAEKISCVSGQVAFQHQELGKQTVNFNVTAMPDNKQYQIKVTGFNLASAKFAVNASIKNNIWQVDLNSSKLSLAPLLKFLSPYLEAEHVQILSSWSIEGDIALSAQIAGKEDILNKLDLSLVGTSFNISDEPGQYVTENVATSVSLKMNKQKQKWQWYTDINIGNGQAYGEPIFIDFDATAITLQAEGSYQQNTGKLKISKMIAEHNTVAALQASFIGTLDQIEQLKIEVKMVDVASLYQAWLQPQPFIIGTAVDNIELTGKGSLQYHQQHDKYYLSMMLDEVFVADTEGRFSLDDISGTLGWTNYDHPMTTDLSWQNASVYAIPLGASNIKAQAVLSSLTLVESWKLPILDGELQVHNFNLQSLDSGEVIWKFEGELKPLSMESLSSTLGWPLLHGELSGVIPRVSYADKKIQIDGELVVNLFNGATTIRDLQLDDPFGTLPQLYANVDLIGLDLDTLTQTFDFGKITGKLDGKLTNLRLSNWQPVQFDAKFATPKGDKSRRRISQRAVDNLSQIGGGAGGILSRSFLRFFEDFSYQRLGLSCKLRNETCEMSGVGEAKQGYYIVKGGGLPPRIDVVGYTQRVDWSDLIERLKAVSQSSGPVIQ